MIPLVNSLLLLLAFISCAEPDDKAKPKRKAPKKLEIGVLIEPPADCTPVEIGDEVEISWNMSSFTQRKFLEATKESESFIFRAGYGEVIEGVDQGIIGMCVGEKRKLNIPPSLAYGSTGYGKNIPGGIALTVQVTLIDHASLPFSEKYQKRVDRLKAGESEEDIDLLPDGDKEDERSASHGKKRKRDLEREKEDRRRRMEDERERRRHDRKRPGGEAEISEEEDRKNRFRERYGGELEWKEGRIARSSHKIPPRPIVKKEEEKDVENVAKKKEKER